MIVISVVELRCRMLYELLCWFCVSHWN